MTKVFLPFKKATKSENKILDQYKKWYENTYKSPLIEIDDTYYYILRTSNLFSQSKLQKIVVVTKTGRMVEDSGTTKSILSIYTYFHYLNAFHKDITQDSKRDGHEQFKFLIPSLEDIIESLTTKVDEAEYETLNNQLAYYNEAKQLVNEIAVAAKKCLQVKEELRQMGHDAIFNKAEIIQLRKAIYEREEKRGKLEALMLENSLQTRKAIKKILTKESYRALIKNKESIERVIKEADYLEYLAQHFIQVGQTDWTFDEEWLGIDKGNFTVEKYINELRNESLGEIFMRTNVAILMKEHWLFSKTCKY